MRVFALLFISMFGLTAPVMARDCHADYAELGVSANGATSKKRQSFVFDGEKRRFNDEFQLQYPSFPGKVLTARFERISAQDYELRRRLKDLKSASLPNSIHEHEVGEMVVRRFVGKANSARYTSGDLKEISEAVQIKAIEEKKLFDDAHLIAQITDIHTHPNLGDLTGIFFSDSDIKSYFHLKEQIDAQIGRDVRYRAIILPNCSDCDDVALIMDL